MSTGALSTNLTPRRILGADDLANGVIGYLSTDLRDLAKYTFRKGGVFDNAVSLVSGGTDRVSVSPVTETYTDGLGRIMKPDAALGQAIRFQNTVGITYQVALKWAQRPRFIGVNPRTGKPEILQFEDTIGESGAPNSVSIQGAGLKVVIDSLCEVSVSHAGRTAVVWKRTPGDNALSESVAIETLTVQFDGANNFVVTAATFGQATASLVANDYRAVVLGPSVKRNTSMLNVPGYAFVGTVTGAGAGIAPSSFSMTNQRVIDASLAGLDDISRTGTNGSLKVSVRADPADANENQLEARNAANTVVFAVDEAGDTTISGLLTTANTVVGGTLTVVGATALNGSVAIGDADADTHSIKGSLTHLTVSNSVTSLAVNAATGRVGIGQAAPGSGFLGITGAVAIVGATTLTGALTQSGALATTASVVNGNAITGTGNGLGIGVVGIGGATAGSIGVSGSGGASNGTGGRFTGTGTGSGLLAIAGASGLAAEFTGGSLGGLGINTSSVAAAAIDSAHDALQLRSTSTATSSKNMISMIHAAADAGEDGWAIYTNRAGEDSVDLHYASVIDGVLTEQLIFDVSARQLLPGATNAIDLGAPSSAYKQVFCNGLVVKSASVAVGASGALTLTGAPSFVRLNPSGAFSVSGITQGNDGQVMFVRNVSGLNTVTINHASNVNLAGAASYAMSPNDTLTLICDGTVWYEISRTVI